MMEVNEKKQVEAIVKEYLPHEETKVEKLKKLNKKVKRPATIFAYTFGVIGSLVLGVGMCLAMKVIGNLMPLGIVIGVLGIAMVSVNYFIYKLINKKRMAKFQCDVLKISNELLNIEDQFKIEFKYVN